MTYADIVKKLVTGNDNGKDESARMSTGSTHLFELTCTAKLVVQICTETLLNSLNIIIISLLPLN